MKTTAKFYHRDPNAPAPNAPLRVAVAAFVEHAGRVLMERRADCGQWCVIGGRMDDDQSAEDALRAEVREESGLAVTSFALFGIFSDPTTIARYDRGDESTIVRVVTVMFRVPVEDVSALTCSDESEELRFFTREELRTLDIIETVRPIVDRYLEDPPLPVIE